MELEQLQERSHQREYDNGWLTVTLCFDDRCKNGHQTFSITGEFREQSATQKEPDSCGCLHKDIAAAFPEFAHLIKWHLCSTDGPLHYEANAMYWAGFCHKDWKDGKPNSPPNVDHFKNTIVYGVCRGDNDIQPDDWMVRSGDDGSLVAKNLGRLKIWLRERKSELMQQFEREMSELGFSYPRT